MEAKPSNTAAPAFSRIEFAKRQAAYKAVADHFNPAADYVGIGSGSTVVYVVEAIAAKGSDVTSNITFIPTGFQSKELIVDACLPLGSIDSLVRLEAVPTGTNSGWKRRRPLGLQDVEDDGTRVLLDVVFDGADEVDEELNCIKGGEVVPTAAPAVLRAVKKLGSSKPFLRLGGPAKAGPVVTDNGNFIIDAPFPTLLTAQDVSLGRSASSQHSPSPLTPDAQAQAQAQAQAHVPDHEQQLQPRHDQPQPTTQTQTPVTATAKGPRNDTRRWDVDSLAKRLKEIVGVVETGIFSGLNGYEAGDEGGGQKPVAAYFGLESGEVAVRAAPVPSTAGLGTEPIHASHSGSSADPTI
ncbi:MAG: ribose-5-phosphate isomerase rki1 [Lichina confinis]|nr:MAG: ribose-5-phosphate isomerase rki1 [Lichina confinis]